MGPARSMAIHAADHCRRLASHWQRVRTAALAQCSALEDHAEGVGTVSHVGARRATPDRWRHRSLLSNCTSQRGTGYLITLPMFSAIFCLETLSRAASADNFHDWGFRGLGDGRLAHAIHQQRERVDHVEGCWLPNPSPSCGPRVFGGDRLRHGVIQHGGNVLREQAVEQLARRLL